MRTKMIAYREALGLTQEQLADKIHKSRSAIAKYETGACDIPGVVLQSIANILHAPLAEVLTDDKDVLPAPAEEAPSHA